MTPCSARPTRASSTNTRRSCRRPMRARACCAARIPRRRFTARSSLFEAITDAGRKGVALQRYKGLGEMNPGPALGDDARHQCALAAAGEDQGGRRGRRHLHQADGRRGRAAPRIHPGQFAERQCRRVRQDAPCRPFNTSSKAAIGWRAPSSRPATRTPRCRSSRPRCSPNIRSRWRTFRASATPKRWSN